MFVAAMDEAMTEPKPILSHPYFAPQTVPRNVQVLSNWHTLDDQSLSMQSIKQLLSNSIPTIRRRNFLSEDECQRLVEIIQTHEIVHASWISAGALLMVSFAGNLQPRSRIPTCGDCRHHTI